MRPLSAAFAAGALTAAAWTAVVAASIPAQGTAANAGSARGLYTAAQAARGKATYEEKCTLCHLDDLSGDQLYNPGPALAGRVFGARWQGRTVLELFTLTKTTMPYMTPGTLTDEEVADLLAFIFQGNKFPPGSSELKADPELLAKIRVPGGE